MAETINLRLWKKRRAKVELETAAAQNRAAFGISKPMKQKLEAEAAKAKALLDGSRLEPKSGK